MADEPNDWVHPIEDPTQNYELTHTSEGFPYYIPSEKPVATQPQPQAADKMDDLSALMRDTQSGLGGPLPRMMLQEMASGLAQLPQQFMEGAKPSRVPTEDNPTGGISAENAGESLKTAMSLIGTGASFAPTRAVGMAGSRLIQPTTEAIAEPFYSQVGRTIENAPQNKASPDQWIGWLRNQPGIKQEELEWMGLPDFLKQQQGPVTKDALQDFVKNNQVELNTVRKGDLTPNRFPRLDEDSGLWDIIDEHGDIQDTGFHNERAAQRAILQDSGLEQSIDAGADLNYGTKFSQYIKNKGDNYGETLLTMPPKVQFDPSKVRVERKLRSITQGDVDLYYGDKKVGTFNDDPQLVAGGRYEQKPDEYWSDVMRRRFSGDPISGLKPMDEGQNFTSSHWDEPNVLANVLHSDRVIDGKKYLQLHELQSDWSAKAHAEGVSDPSAYDKYVEGLRERGRKDTYDNLITLGSSEEKAQKIAQKYAEKNPYDIANYLGERAQLDEALQKSRSGVPPMPFLKSWHELALKRMIKHAADNGYDGILVDRGETVADRYDLSKHVKEIEYIKYPDNSYKLGITDKNGEGVELPQFAYKAEELPNVVGKEVAQKIVDGEGKKYRGHEGVTLDNLDLKMGGEFHKKLYDEKIPQALNKIGKRYGAKVDEGKVDAFDKKASDSWDKIWPDEPTLRPTQSTHKFDFTPELKRKAISEGFSMFKRGGAVDDWFVPQEDQRIERLEKSRKRLQNISAI